MNEQLEKIISFDFDSVFVPEIFSSLLIILVLLILSLAVFISSKKYIEKWNGKCYNFKSTINCRIICRYKLARSKIKEEKICQF